MADSERWIVIPRWDDFQHRDMARSSVPPWIKNYTRLLSDEAYLSLTPNRRAILHGLWLEYARTRRELHVNTASLTRRLAMKVTRRDLEALRDAGYVLLSASNHASNVASEPASLEVEREVEGEGGTTSVQVLRKPLEPRPPVANGNATERHTETEPIGTIIERSLREAAQP